MSGWVDQDRVFIEDLRVQTLIGVYAHEREAAQTVCLDLDLGFDNREPAGTDRLVDTLDYHRISQRLVQLIEAAQCQLLETLAERCAELLLDEFRVSRLRLKLAKISPFEGVARVGVEIWRQR